MIEHGHVTHTGLQRAHNEDTYWCDAAHGLWLVADGMGGPGRGEAASRAAIDATIAAVGARIGIADAIRRAGAAVLAHPAQQAAPAPMGSTLAALRLEHDNQYELAWIGDSRIYLWQNGGLTRVARPANAPRGTDRARQQRPRNAATQALGITPTLDLDVEPVTGQCTPGMQFLLCSDGLTDELDDAQLAAVLARTDLAAQECIDHLLLAALDAGGHDNITAVLVRVG